MSDIERWRPGPPSPGIAGDPVSLGEIYDSAVQEQVEVTNANARLDMRMQATQRRITEVEQATGVRLANPFQQGRWDGDRSYMVEGAAFAMPTDQEMAAFQAELRQLAQSRPEHAGVIKPDLTPWQDVRQRTKAAGQRAEAAMDTRGNLITDPAAYAASFAGSVVGSFQDPVNIIANLAGPAGSKARSVLWNATRQGVANAGIQAVLEPAVQAWRKEAGLEAGLVEGVRNVGFAFAFGAGIDATGRVIGRAGRSLLGRADGQGGFFTDAPAAPARPTETALDALDQAARDRPADDVIRRAAEGHDDALVTLARGIDTTDPAVRGAIDAIEAKPDPRLDRLIGQLGIDDGTHLAALAQAVRNAEVPFAEPPPVHVEGAAPARGPSLSSDRPSPVARDGSFDLDGKPVRFQRIEAGDIGTDAATFQYKSGGDEAGVTGRLATAGVWDEAGAGKVVVFERRNGELVIADGHQRLALAKRIERAGGPSPELDAYVLREADGWTAADVQAQAAAKNLQEASGTAIDAARALRARPELADQSLPADVPMLREARSLARLSDDAFARVADGEADVSYGTLVADLVADPSRHASMLEELVRLAPQTPREARVAIGELLRAGTATDSQLTLLGVDRPRDLTPPAPSKAFDDAIGDGARTQTERLDAAHSERAKARTEVERELAGIIDEAMPRLPEGTEVKTFDTPGQLPEGLKRQAAGVDFDAVFDRATGDIWIARDALAPAGKLAHETVHALRDRGLITDQELRLLADKADATPGLWDRARYETAYAGRASFAEDMRQEAAAHLYERRVRDGADLGAAANGIIDHIQQFLERVRNALAGRGYATAADVMAAIDRGDVAQRAPSTPEASDALFALADRTTGQEMRRELDRLGYYSAALEAARGLKQAKGTPEQMLAQLKAGGARQAEIEASKLGQFLEGKASVTRDQIVGHLEQHGVEIDETVYGGKRGVMGKDPSQIGTAGPAEWSNYTLDPSNPSSRETVLHLPEGTVNDGGVGFKGHFDEPNAVGHMLTSMTRHEGKAAYTIDQIQSDWGQKLRDGGVRDDARLAEIQRQVAEAEAVVTKGRPSLVTETLGINSQQAESLVRRFRKTLLRDGLTGDEANALHVALIRSSGDWKDGFAQAAAHRPDLISEGVAASLPKKIEAMPALQAELAEFNRTAGGYIAASRDLRRLRGELKAMETAAFNHPLVATTDQWTNTVLRRAIRQAAEADADYIAIPHGDTVLSYNPGKEHGMRSFYGSPSIEGVVPKNLRKLLGKLDNDTPAPVRIEGLETPTGVLAWNVVERNPFDKSQAGFTLVALTDKAKAAAKEQGQPLFAMRGELDMSPEARKQRAEEMGFDTSKVWYHGSDATFDAFDLNALRPSFFNQFLPSQRERDIGIHFTSDAKLAATYGTPQAYYVRGEILSVPSKWDFYPDGLMPRDLASLKKRGVAAVFGREEDELIVIDPVNIRSVNAAFDPAKTDSPNLMFSLRDEARVRASRDIDRLAEQELALSRLDADHALLVETCKLR